MNRELEALESLDKLEECAYAMKDLPMSNWIDLADNETELDLKIMNWVEEIKFELFKGKQALLELKQIKEAEPSEALRYVNGKIADLEDDLQHYTMVEKDKCKEFFIREDLKKFTTIKQALQDCKRQLDRSENLEKIFSDSHICEIQERFKEIECSADKCENCPLGFESGVCLKNTFEKKLELQKENKELKEENKELKKTYDNLYNDIINVIQEIKNLTMEADTNAIDKNSEEVFKAIKNLGWNEAIDIISTKLAVRMSIHILNKINIEEGK